MRPTVITPHQETWEPRLLAAVMFALCASWVAGAQDSPGSMHARVSVEIGGAVIKGDADDGWSFATVNTLILPGDTFWVEEEGIAEVEFPGGSFLRLADNSKTQIAQIYPSPVIEAWTGSFYMHRLKRSSGDFTVKTPAGTVHIGTNSLVRVDVIGEGASTISVRFGHADVYASSGEHVRAQQGQRIFVDPGLLPSSPVAFDLSEEDDFDAWNRERVRLLVVGDEPVQAIPRTQSTPVGYSDLAANGEWVYVDNRQYWHPTVTADYVPYRNGRWSYVPSYGHVWIGHHPFSYVTSHYGRWSHHDHHGWLWSYDDVWGPAWVASYRYGDRYFWSPLDPYGRPVHYGHARIHIGDFVISVGASSYAYADRHYGHHSVHPFHDDFFHNIHHGVRHDNGYLTHTIPNSYLGANGIHAWNVFAGNLVQNIAPNLGAGVLVRDYTPRRVIRGLASGAGGGTAVARARRLERSSDVTRFTQSNTRSVRGQSVRTAGASTARTARTRSAALPKTAIRQTTEAIRRTERNRGVSSTSNVRNARATRGGSDTVAPTRQRTASTNRTTRTTERTATTSRNRSRDTSSPRVTTLPSTRTTTSPRTPRATTTTTRSTGTRTVTLPQRSGRDRNATTRSTRSSAPRVASTPRATTRSTTSSRTRTPDRLSGPSVRSPRVTTTPRSTAPRVTSVPRVRTPSGSSSPRVAGTPRRIQTPRTTSAPRVSAPPSRNKAPRASAPTRRSSPAPRVSAPTRRSSPAPRVSAPTRRSSPAPRVSAPPTRRSSPAPRVSAPTRRSSPAPRVSAPTRRSSPAPRVSAPTRRSSPAPRVSAPSRSSAPRVSAPSRSSAPRSSSPSRGSSSSRSSSSRGRSPR